MVQNDRPRALAAYGYHKVPLVIQPTGFNWQLTIQALWDFPLMAATVMLVV
jgi:hypothetical protein